MGNGASYFVFNDISSLPSTLYAVFAVTGAVGVAILFGILPLPADHLMTQKRRAQLPVSPPNNNNNNNTHSSACVDVRPSTSILPPPTSLSVVSSPCVIASVPLQHSQHAHLYAVSDSHYAHMYTPLASDSQHSHLYAVLDSPEPQPTTSDTAAAAEAETHVLSSLAFSPWRLLVHSFLLFKRLEVWLLCPMFFLTGFELAFWSGEFTRLLDSSVIGLVLIFVGVGELVGGLWLAHLSDAWLGRSRTVILGSMIYVAGLVLVGWMYKDPLADPVLAGAPLISYFAAFCFGVGDSVFNTQVYSSLGHLLSSSAPECVAGFTIYQLLQNAGSAVGFFFSPMLPVHGDDGTLAQVYWQAGVAVGACVLFVCVERFFSSSERNTACHQPLL